MSEVTDWKWTNPAVMRPACQEREASEWQITQGCGRLEDRHFTCPFAGGGDRADASPACSRQECCHGTRAGLPSACPCRMCRPRPAVSMSRGARRRRGTCLPRPDPGFYSPQASSPHSLWYCCLIGHEPQGLVQYVLGRVHLSQSPGPA